MSWVLVYGCGTLAYGSEPASRFGGSWETGRIPEAVALSGGKGLARDADVTVSLAGELDREIAWTPKLKLPPVEVSVRVERDATFQVPLLPRWRSLVRLKVDEVDKRLPGGGVLVTPEAWRQKGRGRAFLRAWGAAGWRWAPLEEVLRARGVGGARSVSGGPGWIRVREQEVSAVIPSDGASALARVAAPHVLQQLLGKAPVDLAEEWRKRESRESGWFAVQKIARILAEALREEEISVDLGGPTAPLFVARSGVARKKLHGLNKVVATVDLAPLNREVATRTWWERVADPRFLPAPEGIRRRPSFDWSKLETVIIASPPELEARGERSGAEFLFRYLRMKSRGARQEDPASFREALEVGADVEAWLQRWREEESESEARVADDLPDETTAGRLEAPQDAPAEGPEEAGVEPLVTTPAVLESALDPLADFQPERIRLDRPGRPEVINVAVDGQPVPDGQLEPVEQEEDALYRVEGLPVRHGSIVRIDFEMSREE